MKYIRIALALLLTCLMLYIARNNSRGRPEFVTHSENGYSFEMTTVPKITEYETDRITLKVAGPFSNGARLWFRTSQPDGINPDAPNSYARMEMMPVTDTQGVFYTEVTAGAKAGRFYYYFEITDSVGVPLATFTSADESPFYLRYIGAVPLGITIGHIGFIFATVFFVALAAVYSLPLMLGRGNVRSVARLLFWATVCCFIGGYPLGFPMNYYAFNGLWEGIPFGTDATDNKTQLLFLYLVFATLSSLGSLTRGRFGRDIYSPRSIGVVGLGSFAVMLFIYLIPHSTQFSPSLTYAFCYSWTAVVVLLYVAGYARSSRSVEPS